jgi:ubiquinone/menaquinone biosynthesis C-methylase UbiE
MSTELDVGTPPKEREFGLKGGRVFPAARAGSLVTPLRRLVQSPSRTVAAMGLTENAAVLEVGSGPGFFSPFIASAVPCGLMMLVDLQPEMLVAARQRLARAANVLYAAADACALPIRTGQFDAVFIALMLGEVSDKDLCIEEVRRVLRPDGLVTIVETRRDSDFIPLTSLSALLDRHGFSFVDRRGRAWQYVARFRPRVVPAVQ